MELIPILATIILVATISTFLLAIGAYVLYKIRERKGAAVSAQAPTSIKAELVTPQQQAVQEERAFVQPAKVERIVRQPQQAPRQPLFIQPQAGPQPMQASFNPAPQKGVSITQETKQRLQAGPKFMKVGEEATQQQREVRAPGGMKWR